MTFLSFVSDLEQASGIDLPVEIRRPNLTLVTRTTATRGAVVEPGDYHVIARLPAGQEISASVQAEGGHVQVRLKPEPEEASPHGWQSDRHFLVAPVTPPADPSVAVPPTSVTLRYFSGNALADGLRHLRDDNVFVDDRREVRFDLEGERVGTAWVQLVQSEREPRTTALPVAPGHPCTLRFVRKPEGYWWLDVHLHDGQADLLCRYRDRGWAPEAAAVAEGLLETKLEDPIAAAVGAYAILRLQALDRLHDWTENLRNWFPWLPDGTVVRGEHLARNGEHNAALRAFVDLADRGLPVFSDGLGYAMTRLESYLAVGESELDRSLLKRADFVLSSLRAITRSVDFNHPILGFSGDPTEIGELSTVGQVAEDTAPAQADQRSRPGNARPGGGAQEDPRRRTHRTAGGVAKYAAAIDQGTTSTRCMVFDHGGQVVSVAQKEHEQIYPKPGWVEHDATEVWARTNEVVDEAMDTAGASAEDIAGVGITNQRETSLVWDRTTGDPIMNAVVWQDTRTDRLVDEFSRDGGQARFQEKVGLPLATYFSGPKIRWILDNVDGAADRAESGDLLFGNMDAWVIWNLTGGTDGGLHITDVTNASRTMLMDLKTLDWDPGVMDVMGIPRAMLPEIRASSEVYGEVRSGGALQGVPIAGDLGDQQAATFGQTCFAVGEAKNTYGTGNFLLLNTGTDAVQSKNGLLTTVGYKIGDQDAIYCLEGSIAITGALVQWLRDNLKMIKAAPEVEELAKSVEDNGGCYIVPAFSGLFAPYWKSNARGVVAGLTRYVNAGHIARATLEATAYQSREVVEAMNQDSGVELESLKVDGGMVGNDLLMQFQADLLGVPVIRPKVPETTSLGAAYAAGLATGFWSEVEDLRENWVEDKRWEPQMDSARRDEYYKHWKRAVTRTFDWFDAEE